METPVSILPEQLERVNIGCVFDRFLSRVAYYPFMSPRNDLELEQVVFKRTKSKFHHIYFCHFQKRNGSMQKMQMSQLFGLREGVFFFQICFTKDNTRNLLDLPPGY